MRLKKYIKYFVSIIAVLLPLSACKNSDSLPDLSFPQNVEISLGEVNSKGILNRDESGLHYKLTEPASLAEIVFSESGGEVILKMGEKNISSRASSFLDEMVISAALRVLEESINGSFTCSAETDGKLMLEYDELKLICRKKGEVLLIHRESDGLEIRFSP